MKSTVQPRLPKPYGKGVGAEADTVAGIPTGLTENIRTAVAAMRRAIQNRTPPTVGEVSTDTRSVGSRPGGFFCGYGPA